MVKGLLTSAPCSFIDTEEFVSFCLPPVIQQKILLLEWCPSIHPLYPLACTLGRGELQSQLHKHLCFAGAEIYTKVQHITLKVLNLLSVTKQWHKPEKCRGHTDDFLHLLCTSVKTRQAITQGDKKTFLSKQCSTCSQVTSGSCLPGPLSPVLTVPLSFLYHVVDT